MKFTEVGFHGKDVDSIITDLLTNTINETKNILKKKLEKDAEKKVEDLILDQLLGPNLEIEKYRELLREGLLDEILITNHSKKSPKNEDHVNELKDSLNLSIFQNFMFNNNENETQTKSKEIKISEYRKLLVEKESENMLDEKTISRESIRRIEELGIVFIDEIDKICSDPTTKHHSDASDEGYQPI
jgi:ATP-dependent HslUV protease ATP-binding subunit HslU